MTKTLTEQYKNKELSGWYYVKTKDGSINHWLLFTDTIEFEEDIEEVLGPVPDYGSLYNPNDGRIPVGLFTILKLIKRDIERNQKIRHLTDLECGIKSQVISLLKRRGWDLGKDELVSKTDELPTEQVLNLQNMVEDECSRRCELETKCSQLEKRLEVSEKEHYRTLEQLRIATGALRKYANCKPTEWMSCVTADKALKEMEGVK